MFDRGPYMSYSNCGLPYYVGGEIASRDALFVTNPDRFTGFFRVDVRLNTAVDGICASDRTVSYIDREKGRSTLTYDRLILATGTVPIVPPIAGLDGPNIFYCRTVPDVDAIMQRLSHLLPREMEGGHFLNVKEAGFQALIIGGGYIGLECAEQLMQRGFRITVVEAQDQLMGPLDKEMAHPIELELRDAGVAVILNDGVTRLEAAGNRSKAILKSGREVTFDIAIIGTGVRPNVELAKSAGLRLGKTDAIAVDAHQRTSDPSIFAAGDNCEAVFLPTGDVVNIPLAGPASKQGRVAGQNAAMDVAAAAPDDARRLRMRGVLGTAIVRVGGVVAGGTGLSEKMARRAGIDVAVVYVIGPSHAGYYPGAKLMLLKLLYAPGDGRVLGAQAVGQEGVDKRLDVLATAIQGGMSVEDLETLDLCYAPPFGSAKDVVVTAGFVAANAYRGTSPGASPLTLREELAGREATFSRRRTDAARVRGRLLARGDQHSARRTARPIGRDPSRSPCRPAVRDRVPQLRCPADPAEQRLDRRSQPLRRLRPGQTRLQHDFQIERDIDLIDGARIGHPDLKGGRLLERTRRP